MVLLMAGQMPVVVVSRRRRPPLGAGTIPPRYGQADEVSAPRGGAFLLAQGISSQNSSASLSLFCFLGARVLAKPLQQVSSLGRLVESKRAVPQRRGQPALRVSTAAQTGLNVVHHIETPPVPLLGGGKKKGRNTRRWCENPFVARPSVMASLS